MGYVRFAVTLRIFIICTMFVQIVVHICEVRRLNKEYIEKEAALTEFNKTCALCRELVLRPMCDKCSNADSIHHIKELAPANVKPVVMGEWLIVDESYWRGTQSQDKQINRVSLKCSNCGHRITRKDFRGIRNFCPNCGADMRGEKDE